MGNRRVGFGKFSILVIIFLFIVFPAMTTEKEKWESFMLRDCCQRLYSVSSELDAPKNPADLGKYGARNLFDGNPATCWAEGRKDSGIGQELKVAVRGIPDRIRLVNGYGKSPALFAKNNRIKEVQLTCYAAFSIEGHVSELAMELEALKFPIEKTVTLMDQPEEQGIHFPFNNTELHAFLKKTKALFFQKHPGLTPKKVQQFLLVSCKIQSVYRGTQWNDTCLSELSFHIPEPSAEKTISAIKTNKLENTVFLEYEDGTKDILVKNIHSVFQIVELSPDREWVILIQMPANPGPGRVSTRYLLYNTHSKKKVLPSPTHPEIGSLYGFETQNHTLSLQYENPKTGDVLTVKLTELQQKTSKIKAKVK
ncbi:MAG: hypothetical protein KAH24_09005 [Holophagae bacterium]|nr:hypothetical protein [Holophagae bacterium]